MTFLDGVLLCLMNLEGGKICFSNVFFFSANEANDFLFSSQWKLQITNFCSLPNNFFALSGIESPSTFYSTGRKRKIIIIIIKKTIYSAFVRAICVLQTCFFSIYFILLPRCSPHIFKVIFLNVMPHISKTSITLNKIIIS